VYVWLLYVCVYVVVVIFLIAVYLFGDFSQLILWILYSLYYVAPEFSASLFLKNFLFLFLSLDS